MRYVIMHTPMDTTENMSGACPISGSTRIEILAEIQGLPVFCNKLFQTREAARSTARANIKLGFAPESGHAFNLSFDKRLVDYTGEYENSLHHSAYFQGYAEHTADRLIERYDLHDKCVAEIGCGQGDFLRLFVERGGNKGIGFDPSYVPDPDHLPKALTILNTAFDPTYAEQDIALLCCRHVLEHIDRPNDFMYAVGRFLQSSPDAVAYFEVPNASYMYSEGAVWDLLYEHCSYYSAPSLRRLFEEAGFEILAVTEGFDRQFLAIEARLCKKPDRTSGHRQGQALGEIHALAQNFAGGFEKQVNHWRTLLSDLAHQGKRICLWGAGTKGVTFLNVLGVEAQIAYIVDINPKKTGKYISGSGQRILGPEEIQNKDIDIVLVANPIYQAEIAHTLYGMGLVPDFYSLF